jgi:hypothetical protein
MEWEKAKNIILIFFILLNIILAGFIFIESRQFNVTAEQENIVRSVLEQHNIRLETEIIRRYPPQRALRVSGYYYDENALKMMFFNDPGQVERIETTFGEDFTDGTAYLWISNGFITFYNPTGLDITTDDFVRTYFPDFILDEHFTPHDEEGQRIVYRQAYRGFIIYSNFIEFLVTDNGIIEVFMQFGEVSGWDGPERPIFAPDIILITFMQRARSLLGEQPITIWHMDIVYNLEFENAGDEVGSSHLAIPFYRIFIEGSDLPFLINAYLNVSIDG